MFAISITYDCEYIKCKLLKIELRDTLQNRGINSYQNGGFHCFSIGNIFVNPVKMFFIPTLIHKVVYENAHTGPTQPVKTIEKYWFFTFYTITQICLVGKIEFIENVSLINEMHYIFNIFLRTNFLYFYWKRWNGL